MDIQNPFVWAKWAGSYEENKASPKDGYNFSVAQKIDFDPVHNRMIDTWWDTEKPDEKFTQTIRCYSPTDLLLLLEGAGLRLEKIMIHDREIVFPDVHNLDNPLLDDKTHEYLVLLKKS